MSFQFQKDLNAAESAGQGGLTTGVYKVVIQAVAFSEDKKGNPRADFYFADANGKRAIVFGMCIAPKWLTGADNLDYKKWQEFAAICGMETGAIAPAEVQVSKTKKETLNVFTECTGKTINVALQEKFDIQSQGANAGKETNDKSIYRTFNADGKSLAEIKTNTPAKAIEAIKSSLKPYETPAYKARKAGDASDVAAPGEDVSAPSDEADTDLI